MEWGVDDGVFQAEAWGIMPDDPLLDSGVSGHAGSWEGGVDDSTFQAEAWGVMPDDPLLDSGVSGHAGSWEGGVDVSTFQAEAWGVMPDDPLLDAGVSGHADSLEWSEFWNSVTSGFDSFDSGYVDARLPSPVEAAMGIPTHNVSGQSNAGLGSTDGSQVASSAL
jgi:hypothetical protein